MGNRCGVGLGLTLVIVPPTALVAKLQGRLVGLDISH